MFHPFLFSEASKHASITKRILGETLYTRHDVWSENPTTRFRITHILTGKIRRRQSFIEDDWSSKTSSETSRRPPTVVSCTRTVGDVEASPSYETLSESSPETAVHSFSFWYNLSFQSSCFI
ncbi:hypothetical protein Hdeb2414_s0001g00010011 [Helianthus debilis subsp. tardiflorus]